MDENDLVLFMKPTMEELSQTQQQKGGAAEVGATLVGIADMRADVRNNQLLDVWRRAHYAFAEQRTPNNYTYEAPMDTHAYNFALATSHDDLNSDNLFVPR